MKVDCIDGCENVIETPVVKEGVEKDVIDENWLDSGVSFSAVFGFKPFESVLCHILLFFDYTYTISNYRAKLQGGLKQDPG